MIMDPNTHCYQAFGLGIQSVLNLPELQGSTRAPDITIEKPFPGSLVEEAKARDISMMAAPGDVFLFWDEVGAYRILNGNRILVDPMPGVEERVLRLFLLGTSMGILLHQRGMNVLHGSAVQMGDRTVAFLGEKGAGKSTLATALCARGSKLITDDLLVLTPPAAGKNPTVYPGFPQVKLWPESILSFGDDPQDLPKVHPQLDKRARQMGDFFATEPSCLQGIFILEEGKFDGFHRFEPQQAFLELMPNWYGARFGHDLLDALGRQLHFMQCAQLANQVPVYLLNRGTSLEEKSLVAESLENM